MNKFSKYIKSLKENDLKFFFGEDLRQVSNKYVKFTRVIDEDNILLVTNNVKILKDNYVLLVDNNKGVYLKDWQVRECHNYDLGLNFYVVKLNRNYFKPYTFSFNFENMFFEKEETFDCLLEIATTQASEDMAVALGSL